MMSSVYNPETETIAQIERLELEAREIRRRVEQAHTPTDREVLERQLRELADEVERLRARLP
jgi:urease accessory protein UreE